MLTASCILILLGALLVVAGRLGVFRMDSAREYRGQADGVVSEIVAGEPDKDGVRAGVHDYYYPVFTYYANGRLYKETSTQGSNPCEFSLKERVKLCYDESDPSRFCVRTLQRSWRAAKAVYYSGFACCCLGGVFFLIFATRG